MNNEFLPIYRGRRVLVTGHTGFKGSWLSYLLHLLGAEVMGYALPPAGEDSHFARLDLSKHLHHVAADIRDAERLAAEVAAFKPEFVFHLAAQALVHPSYYDPKTTFDINVGGGVNLLEAVRACDSVRTLVFITSDKCYENVEWIWGYRETDIMGGRDPYSASKGAIELVFSSYLRSYFSDLRGFGAATVRAGNVVGGGDWSFGRIVPDCVRALIAGKPIVIRSPCATRPWQHVLDPLSGYLQLGAALHRDPIGFAGAWNFGPHVGELRTVLDVARNMLLHFKHGEVVVESPVDSPHEAHLLQLNSDKARQLLGWNTRWGFDQTLQLTGAWYREVLLGGLAATDATRFQINEYFGALF